MSKENKVGIQNELGILVPLGQYVLMSTFTVSHDNPHGIDPKINLTAKRCAVWLTGQEQEFNGEKYSFVIGPDGLSSPVAVRWIDFYPEIYIREGDEMVRLKTEILPTDYLNHEKGHRASSISKPYPGLKENYTVIRLPLEEPGRELENARRYFSLGPRPTLISGMNNRLPDVPFARELHLR